MTKWKLFFLSAALTSGVASVHFYLDRPRQSSRRAPASAPELKQISDKLYLTSQLRIEDVLAVRERGIKTVVDIRPDGEAQDQTPSDRIKSASNGIGLGFYYIPVPHAGIPDGAVEALDRVLAPEAMPAVLYCRTGRRAVRLFALVQASRVDGPGLDAIMGMVRAAGFSAEDLRDEITQRLSHRSSAPPVNH
jgi:uncharacterized protein (TIGR01244 family)